MKLERKSLWWVACLLLAIVVQSCGALVKQVSPKEITCIITTLRSIYPPRIAGADNPIALTINGNLSSANVFDFSSLSEKEKKKFPVMTVSPSPKDFAQEKTTYYMNLMGFNIENRADYRLNIDITSFKVKYMDLKNIVGQVRLTYRLVNNAGQTIIPAKTVSVEKQMLQDGKPTGYELGDVYIDALEKINWQDIAAALHVADTPAQEKNASVRGEGDTALEHTVIRWFITSAPQGADVSWRVISSTPDVANTNSNYVGTTPYETTESFDIRGLTYNNSGNIQIEVTCEKPGYLPQKKRFNLRQAIDQKEISAKFNLIKDE